MSSSSLAMVLHAFFHDWLGEQHNASRHTVTSYRDTWRLFLRHVASTKDKTVARLDVNDLTANEVLAFLKHCEEERKTSVRTRNCRLAALRSFFGFLIDKEPLAAAQCSAVLNIPVKRTPRREICYLETEEIAAILAQPDTSTLEGQRDHALLSVLYNTGARIQEVLNLCPASLRLESPAHVRLIGKGRKERTCPLWPETAAILRALLQRAPRLPDQRLFMNRHGQPLGAAGIRFKLGRYVRRAQQEVPTLAEKRVSPHTFRHYLPFLTMSSDIGQRSAEPGRFRSEMDVLRKSPDIVFGRYRLLRNARS
jgi:site-specific recombinase XerD